MTSVAYYVAAIIAILAAVTKWVQTRKPPRRPGVLYLCGVLVCLGLAATALAPATLRLGSHIEPTPNLTRLVGNVLALGAVFCMLRMLAQTIRPADARRTAFQACVLAVVIAAMTVLLVLAHTRFTVDFVNVYASHPIIVAYEVVFLAYATWGSVVHPDPGTQDRGASRPNSASDRAARR